VYSCCGCCCFHRWGVWLNELETSWVIFVEVSLTLSSWSNICHPGPHHELLVNHRRVPVIFKRIDGSSTDRPTRLEKSRLYIYRNRVGRGGTSAAARASRWTGEDESGRTGGKLYSLLWSDPSEQINSAAAAAAGRQGGGGLTSVSTAV
jgi:hypothetical protein